MGKTTHIREGRYELIEIAGRGGMAVVWRGQQHGDVGFQRQVAIKQMHEHLTESQLYIDMFAEEARVCASMQSPNLAQVYDFVQEGDDYYLIIEWVDGIDLGSFIRYYEALEGHMPWEMAAAIGVGILRALADAHEREDHNGDVSPVLHRDISPHNVLVNTRGMVKLIDFGLCLAGDRQKELTEPGVVKGKMSYLSPEIVKGERPTALSDQFSVGSVLWEALAGTKLFDGETDFDVYTKIREGQVAPIRPIRRDLPRGMVTVLQKALAPNPDKRFPSAREFGRELGSILKLVRHSKDLHSLIGQTVIDAREYLEMGGRTGEHSTTTPIADPVIDVVTLPGESKDSGDKPTQSASMRNRRTTDPVPVEGGDSTGEERKGLLHRLPSFFGLKR